MAISNYSYTVTGYPGTLNPYCATLCKGSKGARYHAYGATPWQALCNALGVVAWRKAQGPKAPTP